MFGGEHNTLLHRVSLYRELRALLQLLVYGGEHNTLLHLLAYVESCLLSYNF